MFRTQQNDDVAIAGFGFAILQETVEGKKSLFMTMDVGTPEFKVKTLKTVEYSSLRAWLNRRTRSVTLIFSCPLSSSGARTVSKSGLWDPS